MRLTRKALFFVGSILSARQANAQGIIPPNVNVLLNAPNAGGYWGDLQINKNGYLGGLSFPGGTTQYLRADGTWAVPPSSGGGNPGGTSGQIQVNASNTFGGVTPSGDISNFNSTTGAFTIGSIGGKAVTLGGAFTTTGAYSVTFAASAATSLSLPTSGTLATNTLSNATNATMPSLLAAAIYTNVSSPILSQPGTNLPNANAAYLSTPLVIGYANTVTAATGNTYDNMATDAASVSGTITNHFGFEERELQLSGTATITSEVNNYKNYVEFDAGIVDTNAGLGENMEGEVTILSGASVSYFSGYTAFPNVASGGTLTSYTGFETTPTSNSSTPINNFIGFACAPLVGTGSITANRNYCVYNQDPKAEIASQGHIGLRPGSSTTPTLSSGCTGDSRISDMAGTVTEGTNQTSCVVTFASAYGGTPHCIVTPANGVLATGVTATTGSLTITNASATGDQFTYVCVDTY